MDLPIQNPQKIWKFLAFINPYPMNKKLLGSGVAAKSKDVIKNPSGFDCRYKPNLSRLVFRSSPINLRKYELPCNRNALPVVAPVAPTIARAIGL